MNAIKSLVNTQCILGEGPLWIAEEQKLYWVDIKKSDLFCYQTTTQQVQQWRFTNPLTAILPKADGRFIGTSDQGLVEIDLDSSQLYLLPSPEVELKSNRHNDAKVDQWGNIWTGTMDDNEKELSGVLYRINHQGEFEIKDHGYCVTNGPAFSPDGHKLYHTDTFKKVIYEFDLNAQGTLSNKKILIQFNDSDGFPDGMTTDAEGRLWVCHFGGAKISLHSPTGDKLKEFKMPCDNITSCTFGGPNLDQLFITTAQWNLPPEQVQQQSLAGNLLWMQTDTQGITSNHYLSKN